MVATLCALALAGCGADIDVLIIARDGSNPLSKIERDTLADPTVDGLDALAKEGYIIETIETNVALAIDPTTPLMKEVVAERLFLEALGDGKKPVNFSSMNRSTQRLLIHTLDMVILDSEPGPDSQFMMMTEANFNLSFPGRKRTYNATYRLNGPTIFEMQVLAKNSLVPKAKREPILKTGNQSSLVDNFLPGANLQWRVDIYEKCQQRIVEQLRVEIAARDAAIKSALSKLPKHPTLGSNKDDVPPEQLEAMKRNFLGSWKALGFESEAEAAKAWDNATWGRAGVAFTIYFGDSYTPEGSPVLGGFQFGFTGR